MSPSFDSMAASSSSPRKQTAIQQKERRSRSPQSPEIGRRVRESERSRESLRPISASRATDLEGRGQFGVGTSSLPPRRIAISLIGFKVVVFVHVETCSRPVRLIRLSSRRSKGTQNRWNSPQRSRLGSASPGGTNVSDRSSRSARFMDDFHFYTMLSVGVGAYISCAEIHHARKVRHFLSAWHAVRSRRTCSTERREGSWDSRQGSIVFSVALKNETS